MSSFHGPMTIGRLFDTIGRRKMISFTYIISGVLLAITGWMFMQGMLNAVTQTICWSIIFFTAAGVVAIFFGLNAERQSLESIARPLSFVDDEETGSESMAGSQAAISS